MKVLLVLLLTVIAMAPGAARALDRLPGLSVGAGGGLNVTSPFASAQVGWRFSGGLNAFEMYLDYSYNAPISYFSFQTFGLGARTYLGRSERFQLYHQALAALAVSASGRGPVQDRDLGQRLLGAFLTQGIGLQAVVSGGWTASLLLATGYPVWLRPELTVRYTF